MSVESVGAEGFQGAVGTRWLCSGFPQGQHFPQIVAPAVFTRPINPRLPFACRFIQFAPGRGYRGGSLLLDQSPVWWVLFTLSKSLGADHALPTADLRFYPAALVVPCCQLPGHAAIAADLGNMAIPNGWTPRRLRTDHCVLWRRYNHIQGLPIPFPQQIPCGRSIIGTVRQKARDRGIELIQEPGQGGAVSNVIVSQIGVNNCTAGQVQSEVEFAPAAAYSPGFMLLREPFSFLRRS